MQDALGKVNGMQGAQVVECIDAGCTGYMSVRGQKWSNSARNCHC